MKATPAATKGELLVVGCPTSSCFSSIASTSSSSTSAYTVMAQNSHVPLIIREFAPINTTSIGICASPEARGGPSALSGVSNSVSAAAGDSDADSGRGGSVNNLRCLFPACNDPSQQMSSLEASTSPNLVLATPTGDASFYTGQFLGDSDLEISASTAGSITYATASETTWPPFISMMLETSVPSSAPTSSVMLNSSNLIECHCSLLRERVTTPLDIYKRSSLHFNEDLLPKQNLPTLVQSHELSIPSTSMEIKVTDGHKGGKEKASHNLEGLSLLPANAQRSFRVAGCKDHNEKDEVEIAEDVSEKEVMYADPPNVIRLPPTVSLSEQSFSNFSFESTRTDSGPWQQAVQWPTEPSLSKAAFTTSTNYYSPGAYGPLPEGQCTDSDNANEKKLVSSLKQPGERSEPKRVRYRHPLASTVNTAATLARRKMVKNAASLETKKA